MKRFLVAAIMLLVIFPFSVHAAPQTISTTAWSTYNYINPTGDFQIQFDYPRTEQVTYGPEAYTDLTHDIINLDFARNTSLDLKNLTVRWTKGTVDPSSFLGPTYTDNTEGSAMTYNETLGTYFDHPASSLYPQVPITINRAFVFTKQGYTFAFIDGQFNEGDVHAHPLTQAEWSHILSSLQVTAYATVDGQIPPPEPIIPLETSTPTPSNSALVKTKDSPVVYRMMDGKRQPFMNEDIFHMWYSNFDGVVELSSSELANIPMGSPVLPYPYTFVKIQSMPQVYEVQGDGKTLRWLSSESIAEAIGGTNWNKKIHDIDVTLWQKFTIGAPIDSSSLN